MALKHCVKRRTHKERHQPANRKRLGNLEKKKDYVLRARDYHKKQDHLANLQEKVRLKNPDEFYFRMVNTKIDKEDGRLKDVNTDHLTPEDKQLMLDKDAKYISMQRQIARKKVEKLKGSLHNLEAAKAIKERIHIQRFDDDSDDEIPLFKAEASLRYTGKAQAVLNGKKTRRQQKKQKKKNGLTRDQRLSYENLKQAKEKETRMTNILEVIEAKCLGQSKLRKTKVKNSAGRTQYKFQQKRAR